MHLYTPVQTKCKYMRIAPVTTLITKESHHYNVTGAIVKYLLH